MAEEVVGWGEHTHREPVRQKPKSFRHAHPYPEVGHRHPLLDGPKGAWPMVPSTKARTGVLVSPAGQADGPGFVATSREGAGLTAGLPSPPANLRQGARNPMWDGLNPPYSTIVADPPWMYKKQPGIHGGDGPWPEHRYSTMTNEAIADLTVADLAAPDAHVYLWATNVILTRQRWGWPDPVEIVKRWGFEPKAILTWIKTGPLGMGRYFRGQTEHVIFGVRGDLPIPPAKREQNIFSSPRRAHSVKPGAFFDLVERVSPAPYVELFCRQPRFGWDSWGWGYEEALNGASTVSSKGEPA
jgi:N6-adenosine-specific RNA methylase IME4